MEQSNQEQVSNSIDEIIRTLSPELRSILDWVRAEVGGKNSPYLQLPDPKEEHYTPEEAAHWVVRTSNAYGKACRMAGIARAELKMAERSYRKAWRKALGSTTGKNQAQRESVATDQCEEEIDRLQVAESMVELVESVENSLRLASESARKIYDKISATSVAESRQHHAEHKGYGAYNTP